MSRTARGHPPVDSTERARLERVLGGLAREATGALTGGGSGTSEPPTAGLVTQAVRTLAPQGIPPGDPAGAQMWHKLITTLDRLHGSGVVRLGRPECIDASRLARLAAEASGARPAGHGRFSDPGPELRELAVDRRLRRELSEALGEAIVPAYIASYRYDYPYWHVQPHVDRAEWEVTFHLVLSHRLPGDGTSGSALVAHLPGGVERIPIAPGEAVLERAHGTVHQFEPLKADEERVLAGISYRHAA